MLYSYAKNEDTQLQFIFEAVPVSNLFPYGAKVTYRAFSCDTVYEIVESKECVVGFEPIRTKVGTFPNQGTWFLRGVPKRALHPAPFVKDSRALLQNFVSKFKMEFELSQPDAVHEWESFLLMYPSTDDSATCSALMSVPFKDILFSNVLSIEYERGAADRLLQPIQNNVSTFAGLMIREFETTSSVVHHNRGDRIPQRPAPRVETNNHSRPPLDLTSGSTDPKHMTVVQLKEALSAKGLSVKGLKPELVARLERSL